MIRDLCAIRHLFALEETAETGDKGRPLDKNASAALVEKLKYWLRGRGIKIGEIATSGVRRANESAWEIVGGITDIVEVHSLYDSLDPVLQKSYGELFKRVDGQEFGEGTNIPKSYIIHQSEAGEGSARADEMANDLKVEIARRPRLNFLVGHDPDLELALFALFGRFQEFLKYLRAGQGWYIRFDDQTYQILLHEFIDPYA